MCTSYMQKETHAAGVFDYGLRTSACCSSFRLFSSHCAEYYCCFLRVVSPDMGKDWIHPCVGLCWVFIEDLNT